MPDKMRTIHYKHAKLHSGTEINLQSLVSQAVTDSKDVEQREQEVIPGSQTLRVLSGAKPSNSMWVSRLMQYTRGQRQQFLQKDEATHDYVLDSTEPPAHEQKLRRDFVESILFLAIFKNHVCFVGSPALGSKHVEDHLNWLLRARGAIAGDDHLLLVDQPSVAAIQKIAKHPVDKIEIGADLDFAPIESVAPVRKTKTRERQEGYKLVNPSGDTAAALEMLLGDWFGDAPLKLSLRRNEVIQFKLLLTYSSKRKTDEGFALMEKLAVAGRHFDKDDCKVRLHNAGTLKGEDLKLEKSVRVKVSEGGLVDEFDLWTKIFVWLDTQIASGMVTGQ